jgi:DNA invertase Pin-like site-specific DNA recombinase
VLFIRHLFRSLGEYLELEFYAFIATLRFHGLSFVRMVCLSIRANFRKIGLEKFFKFKFLKKFNKKIKIFVCEHGCSSQTNQTKGKVIMRVAIYVRVSTKTQSTEMQLEEIERYISARGWQKGPLYEDIGTGRSDQRPAYKRLMEDAARGHIQAVIVWKLDRFGRSVKHLLTALQDLQTFGVAFISVRDHMDFTTPAGRMMITMLAAIAEFEADLIRERVRVGVEAKIAKTGRWGRHKGEESKWKHLIPQLDALLATKKSYRAIARELSCPASFVRAYVLRKHPPAPQAEAPRDIEASEQTPLRSAQPFGQQPHCREGGHQMPTSTPC